MLIKKYILLISYDLGFSFLSKRRGLLRMALKIRKGADLNITFAPAHPRVDI